MANLTLNQIEDALLNAIKADADLALVANGGYVKTIESYAGQFEQAAETLLLIFPAVFAVFVQDDYEPGTNEETEVEPMLLTVLVADQNLRGNEAARRGQAGSIGTYRMMDDLRDLLQGATLGLADLEPLQIRRRAAVVNARDLSVYAVEFQTQFLVAKV